MLEQGIRDIAEDVESAPPEFWVALHMAITQAWDAYAWSRYGAAWWTEVRFAFGWPNSHPTNKRTTLSPPLAFALLVEEGLHPITNYSLGAAERLAVVEHLFDIRDYQLDATQDLVNDAARRFRVAIRLEGKRFFDLSSEEIHQTLVRPALILLSDPAFSSADALYRKAYEPLSNDPAGAITAAASAVEEFLRAIGLSGSSLSHLARSGRSKGLLGVGEQQFIEKIDAFRGDADAHRAGTDNQELARLVLHIAAALIVYLERVSRKQSQ